MRAMRVPRSGGMIVTMFLALMATMLLPIVFMAALAASADAHPRALGDTLRDLTRPIVTAAAHLRDRVR